jgi:hypothetical protein
MESLDVYGCQAASSDEFEALFVIDFSFKLTEFIEVFASHIRTAIKLFGLLDRNLC